MFVTMYIKKENSKFLLPHKNDEFCNYQTLIKQTLSSVTKICKQQDDILSYVDPCTHGHKFLKWIIL